MKTTIPGTLAALLALVALISCDRKTERSEQPPPIQPEVVRVSVEEQLKERLGDRFVEVGKVSFGKLGSNSAQDCYHVEVYYREDDLNKRHVMTLIGSANSDSGLLQFSGQLPLSPGKETTQAQRVVTVTIDELMNE